jgi:hypothetical protein
MEQNPYRSPTTDPSLDAPVVREVEQPFRPYRSAHTPAVIATVLLGLQILAGVLTLGVVLVQRPLLVRIAQGDKAAASEIETTAGLESGAALFELATYIPCAIVFIVWLHRSLGNLPALGAGHQRFTTAGAIYWWIVPIASLFKPYQLVGDVWRGSQPDSAGAWRQRDNVALLKLWWTAWVLVNLLGWLEGRLAVGASTINEFQFLNTLGMITSPLSIVTAFLAIMIVRDIDRRQTETARSLGL